MRSLTEYLWFEISNRRGFVNITGTVEGLVKKSGVQEGLCLVNAMHITPDGKMPGESHWVDSHRKPRVARNYGIQVGRH